MDLIGVLRACVLRWWVVLPLLALTAWLSTDQYRTATPQFTSSGVVVIAPSEGLLYTRGSQTSSGVVVTSPFNGGDGPRVVAGLAARALSTATVRQSLLPGGGVALQAVRDVQADTNVVNVTVVADDAAGAAKGLETVLSKTNDVVEGLQRTAGVRDGQFLDAYRGGPVDPPLVSYPDRLRGVVGFGLAGVLLAVVLAVLAQSLLEGRARRRASSPRQAGDPPAHQAVTAGASQREPARSEGGRRSHPRPGRADAAHTVAPRRRGRAARRESAAPPRGDLVDLDQGEATREIDLAGTGSPHRR